MRHIISILIENESGALSRVAGLFSAQNLVEKREFETYVAGLKPTETVEIIWQAPSA